MEEQKEVQISAVVQNRTTWKWRKCEEEKGKRERLHPHLPLLHFLPLPTTFTFHQKEEVRKELECEI